MNWLDEGSLNIISYGIELVGKVLLIFLYMKMDISPCWSAVIPIWGGWKLCDKALGNGWLYIIAVVLVVISTFFSPLLGIVVGYAVDFGIMFLAFNLLGRSKIACVLFALVPLIGIPICLWTDPK